MVGLWPSGFANGIRMAFWASVREGQCWYRCSHVGDVGPLAGKDEVIANLAAATNSAFLPNWISNIAALYNRGIALRCVATGSFQPPTSKASVSSKPNGEQGLGRGAESNRGRQSDP